MGKKRLLPLLMAAVGLLAMAGCGKDLPVAVTESQILGTWQLTGTQEYWRFDSSHNGETWDLADDVQEGEGIRYTWSLSGAELTCVMQGEMGQVVPKVYTITSVSSLSLTWKDDYGNSKTFVKQ